MQDLLLIVADSHSEGTSYTQVSNVQNTARSRNLAFDKLMRQAETQTYFFWKFVDRIECVTHY